jgi:hypothetical protein
LKKVAGALLYHHPIYYYFIDIGRKNSFKKDIRRKITAEKRT